MTGKEVSASFAGIPERFAKFPHGELPLSFDSEGHVRWPDATHHRGCQSMTFRLDQDGKIWVMAQTYCGKDILLPLPHRPVIETGVRLCNDEIGKCRASGEP